VGLNKTETSWIIIHGKDQIFNQSFVELMFFKKGKKVKVALEQAMKAQRGSRSIALLFL
jgi:hypothetical protein